MSLIDKLKRKNAEIKLLGSHPLLKMDERLNVRDAYFHGLVLAAYLDDGQVDNQEHAYLVKVGMGLGIEKDDADQIVAMVGGLESDNEKMALIDEIAKCFTRSKVAKLFLAEFSLVWLSHASDVDKLHEYRELLCGLLKVDPKDNLFALIELAALCPFKRQQTLPKIKEFDSETVEYLFSNVAQKAYVNREHSESIRLLEKRLVEMIEGDLTWPDQFDRDNVREVFSEAGVSQHFVHLLLELSLPHARAAFEEMKVEIPDLCHTTNYDRYILCLEDSVGFKKLMRYFKLLATCAASDDMFVALKMGSASRGEIRLDYLSWRWRLKSGWEDALREYLGLCEKSLAEFEYRLAY